MNFAAEFDWNELLRTFFKSKVLKFSNQFSTNFEVSIEIVIQFMIFIRHSANWNRLMKLTCIDI